MADLAEGQIKEQALRDGGFGDDEISQWKGQAADSLSKGGFSPDEVKQYFGTPEPDNSGLQATATRGVQATTAQAAPAGTKKPHQTIDASPRPVEAEDVWDAMAAAYGNSILQLAKNHQESPIQMGENATWQMHMANAAAGFIADSPAMLAGTIAGGPVGAFALPAALRATLIDGIRKGDFQDPGDFAKRTVGIGWEAGKGALTGLVMEMTGGSMKVANALGSPFVKAMTGTAAQYGAELTVQTTVAAALEGQTPKPQDFLNGAVMIGGLHAIGYGVGKSGYIAEKLQNIYANTGATPDKVSEAVSADPHLLGETLSENPDRPIEAKEAPAKTADEAVDAVLARKGEAEEPEQPSYKDRVTDAIEKGTSKYLDYTNEVDDPETKKLMRLHNAVSDKVMQALTSHTTDFETGNPNGEGVFTPIDEYQKATGDTGLKNFEAYWRSEHSLWLSEKRGIEQPGLRENDLKVVEAHPEVGPYVERVVAAKNRVLDYLADSGRMSKESAENIKEANPFHISMKKLIEPDPLTGKTPYSSREIKTIGDSDLKFKEPILQTAKDIQNMIHLAHETEANNTYVENMFEDGAHEDVIRKSETQNGLPGDSQIAGYVDGKRTLYDVKPEVADALKRMQGNGPALGAWVNMLKPFATMLRMGTVENPLFAIRHSWRNQISGATYSATGLKPFQALFQYGMEYMGGGDSVKQFVRDGGATNAISPISEDYINDTVFKLNKQAPFMDKAWNAVKSPLALSHWMVKTNDNIVRFAEYSRSLDAGASRSDSALSARDVLPDIQKAGLQKSALHSLVPFLNVHMQGMSRMVEETATNPYGFVAKNLAYITVPSVILAAVNHGNDAIDDIPNWQKFNYWTTQIPNWRPANSLAEAMSVKSAYPSNVRQDGDGKWQVNDGSIIRMQKPFSAGIFFGSMFEASLDAWKKKDPGAFGDFLKVVGGSAVAEPIPAAVAPVVEQMTNRNFYTGQPIIRQSMENKVPEMQYDAYTSETAKILGKLTSFVPLIKDIGPSDAKLSSPKIIDNYMHAWSGTLGQYAIDALDVGLKKAGLAPDVVKPTDRLSDVPFVKEFMIRYPSARPQSVSDFEDRYKQADRVAQSIKMMMKQGNIKEAVDLQNHYQVNMARLTGVDKAIQNMNAGIQKVNQAPDIDPVQKRQLIDSMMYQMTSMAKEGNTLMDQFSKNVKSKQAGQ